PGDRGVAGGVPVADLGQMAQYRAAEPSREPPVQRQIEAAPPPGEVLAEFPRGGVEAGGSGENAGADPVGPGLQDGVVVLAGVSDPDPPRRSCGPQTRDHLY